MHGCQQLHCRRESAMAGMYATDMGIYLAVMLVRRSIFMFVSACDTREIKLAGHTVHLLSQYSVLVGRLD
jgi:hypothetical protein